MVRTENKYITFTRCHVNFLPRPAMANCLPARESLPPRSCNRPPANLSPPPAFPLPSQGRSYASCKSRGGGGEQGLDQIIKYKNMLEDVPLSQRGHILRPSQHGPCPRPVSFGCPRLCSCVLPTRAPASGEKDGRVRSEIKRHKQGARGHTLVCLAAALPSTRPPPLASLLHPIDRLSRSRNIIILLS